MGRLTDRLKGHAAIGLDNPVLICHLEAHPRYLALMQELFAGVQAGGWTGCTSLTSHATWLARPRNFAPATASARSMRSRQRRPWSTGRPPS
jgi:hypothetical protein